MIVCCSWALPPALSAGSSPWTSDIAKVYHRRVSDAFRINADHQCERCDCAAKTQPQERMRNGLHSGLILKMILRIYCTVSIGKKYMWTRNVCDIWIRCPIGMIMMMVIIMTTTLYSHFCSVFVSRPYSERNIESSLPFNRCHGTGHVSGIQKYTLSLHTFSTIQ